MRELSITLAFVFIAYLVYALLKSRNLKRFRSNLSKDQVVMVSYSDEDYYVVIRLIPEHQAATLKNVINDTQITVSIRNIYPV